MLVFIFLNVKMSVLIIFLFGANLFLMNHKRFSLHFTSTNSYTYSYSNADVNEEPEKIFSLHYPDPSDLQNLKLERINSAPNVFEESDSKNEDQIHAANENTTYNNNNENNNDDTNNNSNNPGENKIVHHNQNYADYFCTRSYRAHVNSHFFFIFRKNNDILFYAKTQGIITNNVYISKNQDIHIKKNQYDYILSISNHKFEYSLKKKDNEEIMNIKIDVDYGDEYGPRIYKLYWPQDHLNHISRIPKRKKDGSWSLQYGDKFVIPSTKNAIILDENVKPSILLRKIEKNILELEVIRKYRSIYIFSLALSAFLCPD